MKPTPSTQTSESSIPDEAMKADGEYVSVYETLGAKLDEKDAEIARLISRALTAEGRLAEYCRAKAAIRPIPIPLTIPDEESRIAIMADRHWIAGARFGYGCGQFDDRKALDLAIEGRQKLIRVEPQSDPAQMGEPAMPMTAGNWTPAEWKSAEARVFAQRVLYKPDALSAIYKDIAINLQAELDRISTEQTFDDWWMAYRNSSEFFNKSLRNNAKDAWNAAKGQSNGR